MVGNKVSKSFSSLDLEKLVTMRPEQGFRQVEMQVSTFTLFTQSSSCDEVQRFPQDMKMLSFVRSSSFRSRSLFKLVKYVDLMKESDIERQTPTLVTHGIQILSRCTIVQGFFMLTFSFILVQSKKVLSNPNLFQTIKIVLPLPYELNCFCNFLAADSSSFMSNCCLFVGCCLFVCSC